MGIAILSFKPKTVTSHKNCNKPKTVTRHKEGHFIMIKGSIYIEDITIMNIYTPNIGAPKYIKANTNRYEGRNIQQYSNSRRLQYLSVSSG